jgi:hypothetical protein
MNWKKTRITLNVWQGADFKIVENPEEPADSRFRLEALVEPDVGPEFFSSLKQAQNTAALRNELELVRADNQQLRMELDERRQADAFDRIALAQKSPKDDGRGIPTAHPVVTALAAELNTAMAKSPVVIEDPLAAMIAEHEAADEFNALMDNQADEEEEAHAQFNGKPRLAFVEAGPNDRPF